MQLLRAQTPDVDQIARQLGYLGRLGRSMPPAWDAARVSVPVCGPQGEWIGRVLPGRGLYVDFDLSRTIGTRRPIPYVFERTPVMKLQDAFRRLGSEAWAERRAIASVALVGLAACFPKLLPGVLYGVVTQYDGIISARGAANDIALSKTSITTVASVYSSLYRAGGFPVAGTYTNIPGGAAHSRASTGAWSLGLKNPTAPNKKYLLTLGYTSSSNLNMLMLIDLLVAAGNINANATGNQTINSAALTRYTDGAGVLMTFEITTALGATPSNLTVNSYTNQAGTAARSTSAIAMTPSGIVQRLEPAALGPFMELQSGDYGVRSVETLAFSAAMGAGVVALNLYFPLAFIPGLGANVYLERDSTIQIDGLTELVQTSGGVLGCLAGYILANGTSSGVLTAFMRTAEG